MGRRASGAAEVATIGAVGAVGVAVGVAAIAPELGTTSTPDALCSAGGVGEGVRPENHAPTNPPTPKLTIAIDAVRTNDDGVRPLRDAGVGEAVFSAASGASLRSPAGLSVGAVGKQNWADAGGLLHWVNSHWEVVAIPGLESATGGWSRAGAVYAVWAGSTRNLWAAGARDQDSYLWTELWHWDGSTWKASSAPFKSNAGYYKLWGAGDNDVWAIARGQVLHFDGRAWNDVRLPLHDDEWGTNFAAIWGDRPDDVWIAGASTSSRGLVLHWNGTSLDVAYRGKTTPSDYAFDALWGSGSGDVWLGGSPNLHWDGTTWAAPPIPDITPIGALWGNAPTDLWAITGWPGEMDRTIRHFDGTKLTTAVSASSSLNAVAGTGSADSWVVGDHGATLHFSRTAPR